MNTSRGSDMVQGKVAIIVLTYNTLPKLERSFFDRAVQSIFDQSYPNVEVIFVDNGSSDGTPDYLETIAKGKRNCKVLKLKKNYGWSGGNNRGAVLARDSEYLFFMNDDVILLDKNLIGKLVEAMARHPDLGAIQPLIINKDGSLSYGFDLGFSGLPGAVTKPRNRPLSEAFFVGGAALLTRSNLFFNVGMFDEDLFLLSRRC